MSLPEQAAGIAAVKSRSLVVTVEMAWVVDDVDRAVGQARAAVDRAGGYVGETKAALTSTQRASLQSFRQANRCTPTDAGVP